MAGFNRHLKSFIAACAAALFLGLPGPGRADDSLAGQVDPQVEGLVESLATADAAEAEQIVRELDLIWSRSGSPSMDLLLRRGRDALARGEFDEAVGHLSALIDHAPDFAEAWATRAMVFFQMDEPGLAQADLMQALALNPVNFEAAYGLAVIMEETGRPEAAFAGYEAVLSLYPTHEGAIEGRDRLAQQVAGSDI